MTDRRFLVFNLALSVAVLGSLAYLLLVRRGSGGLDLRFLPAVNASLNALAATLLVAGYLAIRSGARRVHRYLMVSAFAASALFLACYVAYHYVHGDTKYAGQGPLRAVYFFVLITHVLLSMGVLPLALTSFYLAAKKRLGTHRKVSRVTLPVWLYVSVTGVVIFFMLRGSAPAAP